MSPPLITLLGGDRRQLTCAHLLKEAGYRVAMHGINNAVIPPSTLEASAAIVLPLPWGRGDFVHAPLCGETISISQLIAKTSENCHVFAGQVDPTLQKAVGKRPLHDYTDYEPLSIAGAVATAEGAISVAMHCLPCTLWQTRVAILGFGRIAKALADRLCGLGADVSVFARKASDRAWAEAYGCRAFDIAEKQPLSDARVIFNTAPAILLDTGAVSQLSPNVLYVELASTPGIDTAAAHKYGIRIETALGLPGKHAPESAGRALAQALQALLIQEDILP